MSKYRPGDLPYMSGSSESQAAAKRFRPYAKRKRYLVYDFICQHYPCCDYEIQNGLDMHGNTQRPRRVELEQAKLIVACGTTVTEKGHPALTYRPTGKPYPEKWDHTYRSMVGKKKDATTRYWKAILLKRPETEQFEGAIEELKELSLLMKEEGTPFGKDLKRICRWLIQQSKAFK